MGSWVALWPFFLCGCVCVTHSRQSNEFHYVLTISHTEPNDPELLSLLFESEFDSFFGECTG